MIALAGGDNGIGAIGFLGVGCGLLCPFRGRGRRGTSQNLQALKPKAAAAGGVEIEERFPTARPGVQTPHVGKSRAAPVGTTTEREGGDPSLKTRDWGNRRGHKETDRRMRDSREGRPSLKKPRLGHAPAIAYSAMACCRGRISQGASLRTGCGCPLARLLRRGQSDQGYTNDNERSRGAQQTSAFAHGAVMAVLGVHIASERGGLLGAAMWTPSTAITAP